MKRLILTLICIATTISIVTGLKCYDCESSISYADCDSKRQELTCDASKGQDRCIKVDVSFTLHSQDNKNFKRGCVKKEECSESVNPMCKTAAYGTSKDCNPLCCSTDLCNAGSNLEVSVVILVSCVLGILTLF
ncbi:uncharacterized protein LOC116300916 [Actinia tenebrosa]|uniref:Uncharacterized protein LOC116300916 n=1 Tax=Actinia tenebrosa TaxID=6105 RepID=A0A6P8IGB3_ACTTE|nr:uncharacterized protein LOC116300916 [Actinia tenebrosa]